MADGLRALGIDVEELPDGARIRGGRFQGGTIDSGGDHRVAMSFAVGASRAAGPVTILDTANVATSYPGFVAQARADRPRHHGWRRMSERLRRSGWHRSWPSTARAGPARARSAAWWPGSSAGICWTAGPCTASSRWMPFSVGVALDAGAGCRRAGCPPRCAVPERWRPGPGPAERRRMSPMPFAPRRPETGPPAWPPCRACAAPWSQRQRDFRRPPGLVADGRDMGAVIFPDADLKVFLTASVEERARRRHKQLKDKGIDVSLSALSRDMVERDRRDSERSIAPLKPSDDARILDTTGMDIPGVVAVVLRWAAERT